MRREVEFIRKNQISIVLEILNDKYTMNTKFEIFSIHIVNLFDSMVNKENDLEKEAPSPSK